MEYLSSGRYHTPERHGKVKFHDNNCRILKVKESYYTIITSLRIKYFLKHNSYIVIIQVKTNLDR